MGSDDFHQTLHSHMLHQLVASSVKGSQPKFGLLPMFIFLFLFLFLPTL
jgi:hypothetical protein